MNQEERQILSDLFRERCSTLSSTALREFEYKLLNCFSVQSVRNVQLWTRNTTGTRNFIPARSSELEFRMRVEFARSFINSQTPTRPQKTVILSGANSHAGQKLRLYLAEPYILGDETRAGALTKVQIGVVGEVVLFYDADSNDEDEEVVVDDTDSEYDDIFYDDDPLESDTGV